MKSDIKVKFKTGTTSLLHEFTVIATVTKHANLVNHDTLVICSSFGLVFTEQLKHQASI